MAVAGVLYARTNRPKGGASPPDGENDASDPVLAMLAAAPIDDEPVTDDDERHIVEGWRAYRNRETISADDLRREIAAPGEPNRTVPV